MAVTTLTDETFETELKAADMAVVDFFASWCGPCQLMKPKFKRLAGEYTHVKFFIVDGEAAPEARKTVKIDNLPYFAVYKNGEFQAGLTTAKDTGLMKLLDEHFGAPAGAEG